MTLNMLEQHPTTERAWRQVLIWEAGQRAARPFLVAIFERLETLEPTLAHDLLNLTTDLEARALLVAVESAEVLRGMHATPETEAEAEAKLAEIVHRAFPNADRTPDSDVEREIISAVTDLPVAAALDRRETDLAERIWAAFDRVDHARPAQKTVAVREPR